MGQCPPNAVIIGLTALAVLTLLQAYEPSFSHAHHFGVSVYHHGSRETQLNGGSSSNLLTHQTGALFAKYRCTFAVATAEPWPAQKTLRQPSTAIRGERRVCLGKIGCQFGLSLPLLSPGRLTRCSTPGLAQWAVIDSVETKLII